MTTAAASRSRSRVRVRGLVQGVGFRPFVHALAHRHALDGWVRNDGDAVVIEVEGADVDGFVRELRLAPPPRAQVEDVVVEPLAPREGERGFTILASSAGARVAAGIGPDVAVCERCLAELFDPRDRRHLYAFTHCASCGPRYTITRSLPYDRPRTSMADFAMCPRCAREYEDPGDRRFHAELVACPACGPRLSLPVPEIVALIRGGGLVAIEGIGGFHLACDARDVGAVARLRALKARDAKPFALMAANLASARRLAELAPLEEALLVSPARPIVIARAKRDAGLAEGIAPGLPSLGVMLPYAPLHHLLFHEAAGRPEGTAWLDVPQELVLVMTSGNLGGEPVIASPEEARARLGPVDVRGSGSASGPSPRAPVDAVISHDRAIVARADDSVVRVGAGVPILVRRARGHAPAGIRLPRAMPSVLALGAHQKTTVCLTRGDRAWVSPFLGDLDDPETLAFHDEALAHLRRVLDCTPVVVAHDLHPDFVTTRKALAIGLPGGLGGPWGSSGSAATARAGSPQGPPIVIAVQHHHAHVAAVLAEHGHMAPALGVALDGFGLGPDGALWGGELLLTAGARFERLGHLAEIALPGGDVASRQPWRMGAAALFRMGREAEIARRYGALGHIPVLLEMLHRGVRAPLTTSCGRWFDAAAALAGVCLEARYEGEAPMRFEGLVTRPRVIPGAWDLRAGVLDPLPLLEALLPLSPADAADAFHGTFAAALAAWIIEAAGLTGISTVALSGGCMHNSALLDGLVPRLGAAGLRPLLPLALPPNDGAISLGQAWIAGQIAG